MFWLFSRVNSKLTNQRSSFCFCFDLNWEFDGNSFSFKQNKILTFSLIFRAFWQQRSLLHWDKNSAWLYFGCRDENENLFEEETAKSVQRIVAFSRKNNSKIYVQDLVVNDGELIYDLIMNRKAHFYICGKVCNYLLNFLHIPHAICTRNNFPRFTLFEN